MDLQRFCIKFFLKPESQINHPAVVEVFHHWVQEQALPGSLIDVADYTHVPEGPGTLLVGHAANLYIDDMTGQEGLVYQSKTGQAGSLSERIQQAVHTARQACDMLEKEGQTGAAFDLESGQFVSNDRLLLPNTDEGFAAIKESLSALGKCARVENDKRERLTAHIAFL